MPFWQVAEGTTNRLSNAAMRGLFEMGKRGPKPKPTALRMFEGDPGRLLPKRGGEPVPVSGESCPCPPDWLGEVGKAVWSKFAPQVYSLKMLTGVDYEHFAQYCAAHDHYHAADAMVRQHGQLVAGSKGGLIGNPAVRQRRDAQQAIRQLGSDFGLSPASRVGLKIGGHTAANPLEEFKRKA